jgi:Autoinducer binding domain
MQGQTLEGHMADLIAVALHAPFRSFEEATIHLRETAARGDVRHLSYWFLNFHKEYRDDVVWLSTYDPGYMSAYMKEYTPLGDPGINELLDQERVVDWPESIRTNPVCRRLYQTASRYGISKYGVSFTFDDPTGGSVVFSVNADQQVADWDAERSVIVERYRPFAREFHDRMRPLLRLAEFDHLSLCA